MLVRLLSCLLGCSRLIHGLNLTVNVHYPQKDSTVDKCGFDFMVEVASAANPSYTITRAAAKHRSEDLYVASLSLPVEYLYTEAVLVVVGQNPGVDILWGQACLQACPKLSPQGNLANSGPYTKTQPLNLSNVIDLWPDFSCKPWKSFDVSFFSTAIGRQVNALARLPGAVQENHLSRPSGNLPPIMFRLNAEWYWDHPAEEYDFWHSLMVNGEMEPFLVVEVYLEGVGWQSWDNNPVYSTDALRPKCGECDEELQFICKQWEKTGYAGYAGGNHSFGSAPAFFEELWKKAVPSLLTMLPERTDEKAFRTGAWGYCIGGLAAFNAITTHPDLYNMAYLGSPAMDFDCGSPFQELRHISPDKNGVRPKIYIDSGADEGEEMNRQSALLFQKLQERGLVAGQDVFYSRAPFGTHQSKMFLRRALKGLLFMFGSGGSSLETYQPISAVEMSKETDQKMPQMQQPPWLTIAVSFLAGLWTMHFASRRFRTVDASQEPLLGA